MTPQAFTAASPPRIAISHTEMFTIGKIHDSFAA